MKYRKKPVIIDAVQWNGVYGEPPCVKMPGPGMEHLLPVSGMRNVGVISTLEGDMLVREGEWVITGVKGENYPCKDDIFRATYEPADSAGGSHG